MHGAQGVTMSLAVALESGRVSVIAATTTTISSKSSVRYAWRIHPPHELPCMRGFNKHACVGP